MLVYQRVLSIAGFDDSIFSHLPFSNIFDGDVHKFQALNHTYYPWLYYPQCEAP